MLRSHHYLRGFVKLVLWDVHYMNGFGSFQLGYVGVGFWRKTVTAGMVSLMFGGGFCGFGYSGTPQHKRYHTRSHSFSPKPYTYIT